MPPTSPLNRPIRLVVLISGGGTTLVNLADTIRRGDLDATIPLVISSRSQCGGIARAAEANLSCETIIRKDFDSTDSFSAAIFQRCHDVSADLVICGEVGLAGEVRQVGRIDRRLSEAARLGFGRVLVPRSAPEPPAGCQALRVAGLLEAIMATGLGRR